MPSFVNDFGFQIVLGQRSVFSQQLQKPNKRKNYCDLTFYFSWSHHSTGFVMVMWWCIAKVWRSELLLYEKKTGLSCHDLDYYFWSVSILSQFANLVSSRVPHFWPNHGTIKMRNFKWAPTKTNTASHNYHRFLVSAYMQSVGESSHAVEYRHRLWYVHLIVLAAEYSAQWRTVQWMVPKTKYIMESQITSNGTRSLSVHFTD